MEDLEEDFEEEDEFGAEFEDVYDLDEDSELIGDGILDFDEDEFDDLDENINDDLD